MQDIAEDVFFGEWARRISDYWRSCGTNNLSLKGSRKVIISPWRHKVAAKWAPASYIWGYNLYTPISGLLNG